MLVDSIIGSGSQFELTCFKNYHLVNIVIPMHSVPNYLNYAPFLVDHLLARGDGLKKLKSTQYKKTIILKTLALLVQWLFGDTQLLFPFYLPFKLGITIHFKKEINDPLQVVNLWLKLGLFFDFKERVENIRILQTYGE